MRKTPLFAVIVIVLYGCLLLEKSEWELEKSKCDYIILNAKKDMYEKLYLKANTRMIHINDSIKLHCLCR